MKQYNQLYTFERLSRPSELLKINKCFQANIINRLKSFICIDPLGSRIQYNFDYNTGNITHAS